ncbi:MAG TPA: hypothetical protein DCS67_06975, partial [Clostridiales bacterium UBA8960]|nr:hypothetical protein [Clostridiales bacterium UBA8960]
MTQLLLRVFPNRKFTPHDANDKDLTRSEMIALLIKHLELDKFISKFPQGDSPFMDVHSNQSNINFALQFGFITMNKSSTFRPDDLIKKEEAYAILYNVYKTFNEKFEMLHSYYALSSYQQMSMTESLNALSFGWSRLEFNADKTNVVLNMSRSGGNEYTLPSGYTTAINKTEREDLSRQLMVFVKEESIYDAKLKKNVTLAEALLSNEAWRDSVINDIMNALQNNTYKIPFDGVLIDIEGLKGETNARNLNAFIKLLSERLKQSNLSLYVAVHPVGLNRSSYFDGYDYKTIGSYADYVILMAHDYQSKRLTPAEMAVGYTVTPLTPISEIFYALAAVTDPISGVQDSRKVMLQFSMDTVQWKLKEDKVIHAIPYRPLYDSVYSRINEGAVTFYSENLQNPYITFNDLKDG